MIIFFVGLDVIFFTTMFNTLLNMLTFKLSSSFQYNSNYLKLSAVKKTSILFKTRAVFCLISNIDLFLKRVFVYICLSAKAQTA